MELHISLTLFTSRIEDTKVQLSENKKLFISTLSEIEKYLKEFLLSHNKLKQREKEVFQIKAKLNHLLESDSKLFNEIRPLLHTILKATENLQNNIHSITKVISFKLFLFFFKTTNLEFTKQSNSSGK